LIEHLLPKQRGNVRLSNVQVLNGILFVAVNGCTWRGLPEQYGRWHTVYTRFNRWAKAGVVDRIFEELQVLNLLRVKIEAVGLDSTSVKVHPDGTGALKKGALKPSAGVAAGSPPRFIWLPRASSRFSASP
jgi:transposase